MPAAIEWVTRHIPSLAGRLVLITGANSGIGFAAARLLAQRGGHVVLACRNPRRGEDALRRVQGFAPDATVELLVLDLGDLAGIRAAVAEFAERHGHLEVLINNASVMATPLRRTADGFELQFGTNHLGHFALTGLLLPALLGGVDPRVVTVSSGAHRSGRMRFDDPNWHNGYQRWAAYGQSKLANLLFTFELQRRSAAARLPLIATAAHPGYTSTELQAHGPQMDYWGPGGRFELRGLPARVPVSSATTDPTAARRLWELSEQLTGVTFDALSPAG